MAMFGKTINNENISHTLAANVMWSGFIKPVIHMHVAFKKHIRTLEMRVTGMYVYISPAKSMRTQVDSKWERDIHCYF